MQQSIQGQRLSALHAGGEVFVPAGSFYLSKRIAIEPTRPFALKGIGPDVSRLRWSGENTEGLAITPKGNLDACCNDGAVLVSGALMVPVLNCQQAGCLFHCA